MTDLFRNGFVSDNWTGNELRKEGYVKTEIQRILLRLCGFALDIDDIRKRLKGKEGDPYGQCDFRYSKVR